MANWTTLKTAVNNAIKTNGSQQITGQALQNVLNNIITSVGENAAYKGVAIPTTAPGTPDGPVFYFAMTDGTYSNFSNLQVSNEIAILYWSNGAWVKHTINAATKSDVTNLASLIGNLESLKTEEKTNLVAAINEAISGGGGAGLPGISSIAGTSKTLLFDQSTTGYTAGLLEQNGKITSGYSGHTSDFIEVESSDIISVTPTTKNYDYKRPIILGYDANKNVVGLIASAIDYTNTGIIWRSPLYFEYYQIPSGVKYVRLSSNTASFAFYKIPFNSFISEITNRQSEDSGIFSPYDSNTYAVGVGGAKLKGEAFIPVYEGLTVFCSAVGFQNAKGLGLYNSSKEFIKSLPISYGDSTRQLFTYRFTKEDVESGVAYFRADSFYPVINVTEEKVKRNVFFILNDFSSLTNADKVFLKFRYNAINVLRTPSASGIRMSINQGATKVDDTSFRTIAKAMAIVGYSATPETLVYYGDKAILFAEIEVSELPSDCTITIAERKLGIYEGLKNVSNGIYYIPIFVDIDENRYLHVTVSGSDTATALVSLKRYVQYYIPQSLLEATTTPSENKNNVFVRGIIHKETMLGGWLLRNAKNIIERYYADDFMSNATSVSRFAKEAGSSLEMETHRAIKGKAYVSFGTSITQGTEGGYTQYIARFFGLRNNNLGISGSVPHGTNGSLRDERLALIPSDTALCTICYGANGWVHTDDIDSRDTENSIGAINHAIDYLRENNPDCVIVLGLDYGGPFSTQCKDIKAIAERRGIHYAPTEYIDGDLQWDEVSSNYRWTRRVGITSYDGVHLNVLGNTRMASAFINTASKMLSPKGVN